MTASTAKRSTARKATAPEAPSPEMEGAAPAADAVETQPTPEPTPEPEPDVARAPKHGAADKPEDRVETYEAVRPDGTRLKVVRNVETGEATYTPL